MGPNTFWYKKVLYPKFCGPKFFRDPNIFWNPTYPTHINPTNHSKSSQHDQPNRQTWPNLELANLTQPTQQNLTQNFWHQNFFWFKYFGVKICSGPKFFRDQNFFGTQTLFGLYFFGIQFSLGLKFVLDPNFFITNQPNLINSTNQTDQPDPNLNWLT